MITIFFQLLVAIVVMVLSLVTVIRKLFVSRQLSDKFYKNLGLAVLSLGTYVNFASSFTMGLESRGLMGLLQSGELSLGTINETVMKLINFQNQQSIYLILCIVFYGLTLLLLRSIKKDIEKEADKPKYRWSSIN